MSEMTVFGLSNVSDHEIKLLKIFKTVVECGGFSAAEVELNISRSTISVHMSNLESRLKLKLCQRGRSGFSLSEEGETIYRASKLLFSRLEEFRATVNDLHQQMSGELRILTSDTISLDQRCRLDLVLANYAAQAPQVHIIFDTAPLREIERRVINSEADVGFIPHHRDIEGLDVLRLYKDLSELYCSNTHPLFGESDPQRISELLHESKFVHAGVQTNRQASSLISQLNKAAEAYYYETRATMILSGAYIGFLPQRFAMQWQKDGLMKPILPDTQSYEVQIAAISRRTGKVNKPRDLFLTLLQAQVTNLSQN
jgi:DNA-binding transcriptional LysR family regulator